MKWMTVAAALVFCCTARLWAEDAPAAKPAADEKQMQTWWDDLEKSEPDSSRALLKLADHPTECVAFFKDHLQPLTITEERVKSYIKDLESDDANVWKPAFEMLQYFDPRLAIDLPTLMNDNVTPRSRNRLVEILCGARPDSLRGHAIKLRLLGPGDGGYNFSDATGSWWAEHRIERLDSSASENRKPKWTRACRAIILLEHIASPEAVAILRDMATGHADATPTKAAKEALGNIAPGEKETK